MPAPSNNKGFKNKELRYQAALAIQPQIIALASYRGQRIFRSNTGHFYTPHSGRNFMPSASAVLHFSRNDQDMLGGWSAEGSERSSRAAKYKIACTQQSVSSTFKSANLDPLAEADDVEALGFRSSGMFWTKKYYAQKLSSSAVLLRTCREMTFQTCRSATWNLFLWNYCQKMSWTSLWILEENRGVPH